MTYVTTCNFQVTHKRIEDIVVRIAKAFNVTGPFNMQLIAKVRVTVALVRGGS